MSDPVPHPAARLVDPVLQVRSEPPADWDELAAHAASDFFGTRLFATTLARHLPDARPLWALVRSGGRLVGGLAAVGRTRRRLVRWHSLPDGATGGPLLAPGLTAAQRERVAAALISALEDRLGGAHVGATVSLPAAGEIDLGPLLAARGWEPTPIPASVVPLAGDLAQVEYDVLPKNRRNERNRGLRRGAEIGTSYDPADLEAFHDLYLAAARAWDVEPVPLGCLRELLERGEGKVFLCTVRYDGRLIGAHFDLHHGRRVTAWVGATDPEHNRHLFPATLLIWQGLVECDARGATAFDLGGSAGRGKLADFKRRFGAEIETRALYTRDVPWYRGARRLAHRLRRLRGGGSHRT
jgi:CelD/BcsL family acetyltransferase involved in cellulose biosynthesis